MEEFRIFRMEVILKQGRLEAANQLLQKIASCGRKFFYSPRNNRLARFVISEANGRLYFVDDRNGQELPLSHCHSKKWRRYFSHGGTLKGLIEALGDYIRTGKTVDRGYFFAPQWYSEGDPWGYGEDMRMVRDEALRLKVVAAS